MAALRFLMKLLIAASGVAAAASAFAIPVTYKLTTLNNGRDLHTLYMGKLDGSITVDDRDRNSLIDANEITGFSFTLTETRWDDYDHNNVTRTILGSNAMCFTSAHSPSPCFERFGTDLLGATSYLASLASDDGSSVIDLRGASANVFIVGDILRNAFTTYGTPCTVTCAASFVRISPADLPPLTHDAMPYDALPPGPPDLPPGPGGSGPGTNYIPGQRYNQLGQCLQGDQIAPDGRCITPGAPDGQVPVPEPFTLGLFGIGFLGLAAFGRPRSSRQNQSRCSESTGGSGGRAIYHMQGCPPQPAAPCARPPTAPALQPG